MKPLAVIGIDPGKSGGIAVMIESGLLAVYKMPTTEHDIAEAIAEHEIMYPGRTVCYLEKVGAMPGQGVTSVFTFGRGYGFLRGVITAMKIPLHEVPPNKWQKFLSCQTKGDKNVTKAAAQRLYPHTAVTHTIADAILIAEYGRQQEYK